MFFMHIFFPVESYGCGIPVILAGRVFFPQIILHPSSTRLMFLNSTF